MNNFSIDKNSERRKLVAEAVREGEHQRSGGASSDRYFFNGKVYKIPSSKKSLFKPEEVEKNIKILSKSGVDFADTILGIYDLSDVGYASETPVVIQEQADSTYQESINNNEATKETWNLFDRAVEVADNAIESEIVLDGSLSNFGLYGNRVLFIDVQDGNSVEEYSVEKFEEMYISLATSMTRVGVEKEKAIVRMDKNSRFFTR